jgi:cytochrome P450
VESTQSTDVGDPTFDYEVDFYTGQPYPLWEQAREQCPVILRRCRRWQPVTYSITKWDDVETVLRATTFSSSINAEHIGQYMGELILAMDGKEHRAYRNLVAPFRASRSSSGTGCSCDPPSSGCSTTSRRPGRATSSSMSPAAIRCR